MLAGACALALAGPATASPVTGGQAKRPPAAWPKAPYAAQSGDFAVLQIMTDQPEKLIDDWQRASEGVHVVAISRTARHKPIYNFIAFQGCQANDAGECDVTVDYDVRDPAGKQWAQHTGEVWVKRPAPGAGQLQLSLHALGLQMEAKDPLGVYLVRASITDHISGVTLATQQELTVAEK
jgi:hypothetical protein